RRRGRATNSGGVRMQRTPSTRGSDMTGPSMVNAPGPLLAAGRDCDIFEYGHGLVLRRSRLGRTMEHEARVMEYARKHAFPVPAIEHVSADGTELVMQRID